MKRILALILLASLLSLSACGVPQKEVDALVEEIASLESRAADAEKKLEDVEKKFKNAEEQIKTLEKEKNALTEDLEEALGQLQQTQNDLADVQSQYDELKNGPDVRLAEIRTAYDAEDWGKVISLAKALHDKHPGCDQDIEAQSLAETAQKTLDEEAAKAAAEAAKTIQDKVRGLIRITRLDCSKPNSADGVGINLHFVNMHPEKTIKYLEVVVCPYNAVGDSLRCEIRRYSNYTCEATGPYAPGKGINAQSGWWWPNAWYNSTIKYIELVDVRIEYTDGTYVDLSSKEVPYAIW